MNGKPRFFHSLLIAMVAGFSYYILADVDFETLKMKTFSSLGIPYKMYEMNNSVIQERLPMPKMMYAYKQQDVLKDKTDIEVMASYDEFIEGFNSELVNLPQQRTEETKKISDIYKSGMTERNPETALNVIPGTPVSPVQPVTECGVKENKVTIKTEISKDDIEMYVSAVSDRNVKKIEECFKKVTVIVGNENGGFINSIVKVNIVPNIKSSCTNNQVIERRKMKKAPAVANDDEGYDNEAADYDN